MWENFLNKKVIIPVIIIVLVVAGYSLYDYFYISEFVKVMDRDGNYSRRMFFYTTSTDFKEIKEHAQSFFHETGVSIHIDYFNNRKYTPEDYQFSKECYYHHIAKYEYENGEKSFETYPTYPKSMIKE